MGWFETKEARDLSKADSVAFEFRSAKEFLNHARQCEAEGDTGRAAELRRHSDSSLDNAVRLRKLKG